jgi:hypothetical protein
VSFCSHRGGSTEGYFAGAFLFFFARARRSVFLRRALRFLTLSLPWLFPIRLDSPPPVAGLSRSSFNVGGSPATAGRRRICR